MRGRFLKTISFMLLWTILLSVAAIYNTLEVAAESGDVYQFKDGVIKGGKFIPIMWEKATKVNPFP